MQINQDKSTYKWKSDKLNILIPMAGHGSRFKEKGYVFPKPLISIKNQPMIQTVVQNIAIEANFHFIILKEHNEKYNIKNVLKLCTEKSNIIELDHVTEGAACTSLLAEKFIDNDSPLLIANSDQYIKWDSSETMYSITSSNYTQLVAQPVLPDRTRTYGTDRWSRQIVRVMIDRQPGYEAGHEGAQQCA